MAVLTSMTALVVCAVPRAEAVSTKPTTVLRATLTWNTRYYSRINALSSVLTALQAQVDFAFHVSHLVKRVAQVHSRVKLAMEV